MEKGKSLLLAAALAAASCALPNALLAAKTAVPRGETGRAAKRILDLGLERFEAKDYSGAVAAFDRATRADGGSANAFYHLASAYYHRAFTGSASKAMDESDVKNAIDAYETALAIDPALGVVDDPFLLYHGLSQCYEAAGRMDDALEAVKNATRVSRRNPMPYLYGARIRFKMQDFDKSAENLYYGIRRARRIDKYSALSKLVRTSPHFAGLLSVPQNKMILDSYDAVEAGTLTEKEAKERIRGYQPYRDALTGLPTRSPKPAAAPRRDEGVLKTIAEAHRAFTTQHYRDAAALYQKALAEDSSKGTLGAIQKSMLLERIGSSYRHLGLLEQAIRVFKIAVSEMPHNTAARYQLALSYSVNGELGNAMTALNQALDSAHSMEQLRKTLLMARTDAEFEPLRDLPRFQSILRSHADKLSAKR